MYYFRQAGESDVAYQAARIYFELGPERSLEAVRQRLGKSKALMERWSTRFHWVDRAASFDDHLARQRQAAMEHAERADVEKWATRRAEQREREWQLSERLIEKATQMLNFPLQQVEKQDGDKVTIIRPARWSFADAAKLLDTAAKAARLAAEMETERTAHSVTVEQLATMSLEQLEEEARKRGLAIEE